ncbi:MAG: GNAT family N-acyltransferase [Sulfurimonadaceae bacterium]
MSYQFIEVTSEDLLEKVFAFRYGIVCEKLGVSELEGCEPNRETDEYDAYSEHFAAFDEVGEVIAYTRLIHHSPIGYPATNHLDYDTDTWHFDPEQLGEFSRIFVSPQMRSIQQLRPLFDTLKIVGYDKMIDLNIAYTLGALEKPFFRLLNILHFPYKRIGDLQSYVGQRYPSILYTNELRAANTELFGQGAT